MSQVRRTGAVRLPAARLLGVVRRRRAALMVSTALQAGCALVLAFPAQAQPAPNARPMGGQVVAGTASISQAPSVTTITQSSPRAAVNWQSFNVGSQQTVQFAQPSASAATLNRVVGSNPSQIAGRINANGQVILVNQDGVTFYKGAQVNAAGLVVSAAGISNQNFMAGRMVFDQAAAANARIENQGNITVKQAGLAALVAPQVANSGVITAKLGHVVLAGAKAATLDLYGDGLVSIDVTQQVTKVPLGADGKPVTALVTNTGTVLADGGTVQLTAQAVDGIVQNLVTAGGRVSANSVGSKTGEIVINGIGGSITVAGQLSTQGVAAGTRGGQIKVDADGGVMLAPTAVLNASGKAGGGTVAVGTTLARAKGGPSVKAKMTASSVTVAAGAQILADATGSGNGGRVAVLSAGNTEMDGSISAKGGPLGGDGGFVETSGQTLGLTGNIDVSAPVGATGTILLDPGTLDIVHATGTIGSLDGSISAGGTLAYNVPDSTSTGSVTDFKINQLGTANVVLQATTLLDVQTSTSIDVAHGLTLQSGDTLEVDPGVTIQAGTTLLMGSGIMFPAGTVGASGTISISTADSLIAPSIILQGGSDGIGLNRALLSAATSLDISASGGGVSQLAGGTISTPLLTSSDGIVGAVSLAGTANAIGSLGTIQVSGGGFALTDTGNLSVGGTVTADSVSLTTVDTTGTPHAAISVSGSIGATLSSGEDLLASGSGGITLSGGGALTTGEAGTVDLSTTGGGISQAASALIDTEILQSTGGIVGTASLMATGNTFSTLGNIAVTGGNFDLFDASPLTVSGQLVASGGNILLQEGSSSVLSLENSITAATTGTISLVADSLLVGVDPVTISAAAGAPVQLVEIAPATTTVSVALGLGAGLVLPQATFDTIKTQTLRVGAFTQPGGTVDVTASSISFGAPVDLSSSAIANTLDLQANGPIDQPSVRERLSPFVSVGTLTGSTNGAADSSFLLRADNTIDALGSISVAGGNFLLNDTAALTVVGSVSAGAPPAPDPANMGTLTIATDGTLSLGQVAGLVGNLNAGTVVLSAEGTIAELNGSIAANTLTAQSTTGSVLLTGGSDQIDTLDGLSAAGAIEADADPSVLTLTDGITGSSLFFKNPSTGGTIALQDATLTATGTSPLVSLVADHLTQPATSTIIAAGGTVQLAPASPDSDVTVGGTADTLGAVLSAITMVGTVQIGGYTPPGSPAVINADNITFAATADFGPIASTLLLQANGAVTQGTGDSLLNLPTLAGTAASFALLDGGNEIDTIAGLSASAAAGVAIASTDALSVTGLVSAPAGQIFLQSSNAGGVTLSAGGTLAGGTLTSVEADAFSISIYGGTVLAGPEFELAPLAGTLTPETMTLGGVGAGLSLETLNGIGPDALRLGAVTLPGDTAPTTTAGSIVVAGTFGIATVSLELDSLGGITEAAPLTAGTLSGTAGGTAALSQENTVTTLAAFSAAQGFTLDDTRALTVTGAVSGGPSADITDAGLLTVATTGSVTANAIVLNAGSIELDGLVMSSGVPDTVSLVATSGTINEPGTLTTGTLSGSAILSSATLTGTNTVGTLAAFSTAQGFTLDDAVPLTVTGLVAGGTSAVLDDTGLLTVGDTGSVTANAIALNAGSIELDGLVMSSGVPNTVSLVATSGTINEPGMLTTGTLSGSAILSSASLTGTNMVGTLAAFTAAQGFTLDDAVPLTMTGAVSGGTSAVISDPGQLLTVATTGSVTASAIALNAGDIAIDGLVSDGGAGTTSLTATGEIVDDVAVPGTITETGTLVAGALSGSATGSASLTGMNDITDLGPFSADGLTVADGSARTLVPLTIIGTINGTTDVTITDNALLTVTAGNTVTASAVALNAGSIELDGLVMSSGVPDTVRLVATDGTINEPGTLTTGTLSGSAADSATLTGTNTVGTLAAFSAAQGFTLDDTGPLTVTGAVAGGTSAVLGDPDQLLTVATTGRVTGNTVALNAGSLELDGLVKSNGGPDTVSLTASDGTINEPGMLITGTLSGSAILSSASLTGTNMVGTLAAFSTAQGFTLDDAVPLTVTGLVAGGTSAVLDDTGLLTVGNTGSVTANAIVLNAGSIELDGLVMSSGVPDTVSLVATSGTINEPGTLTTGTLSGSAILSSATLTGTNTVGTLAAFSTAQGFTLDDAVPLTVTGLVAGGTSAVLDDTGLLTVGDTGSVTANAIALNAGSIELDGLVMSSGVPNTVSLVATSGTINEPGMLTTGTLSGSAILSSASLTGTNMVGTLAAFTAAQGFTLDDAVPLTVTGAVSGGTSAVISDPSQLLTVATTGSVTASAIALNAGDIAIDGLVSDGGAGTTSLTATGEIVDDVAVPGTITETGTLVAGALSGSATGSASLTGMNDITDLGPFSADGLTVADGSARTLVPLTIIGTINGTTDVTITDSALLTVTAGNTVTAGAVALSAGSIELDGLVMSSGVPDTVRLVATDGTINEPGTLTTGTLSGSAADSASLTGTNTVGTLAAFSAAQGFTLDDTGPLTVTGAVAGGTSAVLGDPDQLLTVASTGSVMGNAIALNAGSIAIDGLVKSNGGPDTVSLVATVGTIDELGMLITGTLSGSATLSSASLTGTNMVGTLAAFSTAQGFTLDDAVPLTVTGLVAGGTSAVLDDTGLLTVGNTGRVTANAIALNAGSIELDGLVMSNGGPDTVSLVATSGTINEPGTLTTGTLSGSAILSSATLTGTNTVGTLAAFSTAQGFTLDDAVPLTVTGLVAGGTSAVLDDTGLLTVGDTGSVTANAIALNAGSIELDGLVMSSGVPNTVSLVATSGTINEPGMLTTGTLSGSAILSSASLTGTNMVGTLAAFTAAQGFTLDDAVPLTMTGAVSGGTSAVISDPGQLLTVATTGSVTASAIALNAGDIAIDGLVSDGGAGTTSLTATGEIVDDVAVPGTITETGTLVAGALSGSATGSASLTGMNDITDLGPFSADGLTVADGSARTLVPLTIIGTINGTTDVTITDSALLTVTAGNTVTAGAVALSAGSIELDGLVMSSGVPDTVRLVATDGTINEPGTLTTGTLSGSAADSASLTGTNTVGTLAAFSAAQGFTLDDTGPLTVTGAVAGGTSAVLGDPDQLLTVASTGSVMGNAIALNAGSIAIDGLVKSNGGPDTVSLVATVGTIDELGMLITGTLSGSATLSSASLTGTNMVGTLAAFSTAQGFTLDDAVPLTVTGLVAGGTSAVLDDTGLLTVGNTGRVTANAIALNAGSIELDGLVMSNGGPDTVSLVATSGTINEPGTLTTGTLSGSAILSSATLTGTNTVGTLAAFSTAQGFTLDDAVPLTVTGAVSGGTSAVISDPSQLLTVATTGSVTASAIALNAGDIAIDGLVSDGGAGTTSLTATGEIVDDVAVPGTITETGTLVAGALSGSATGSASLTGVTPTTNRIAGLGPFSANTLTVDDGIALTVTGPVAGGPSATITDAGLLTVATTGSVTASAIALTAGDIAIDGLVSDGGAGTTSLIATGGVVDDAVVPGTITETGTLVAGALSGSTTGSASLTGATPTTNQIADLGVFSANGLTVDDGIALTMGAAVSGGPSATITDAGLLTVTGSGSVTANAISMTGATLTIAGLVSDGGAGTTSLIATAGTIGESGTLISGTLSGNAATAANLLGATPTTNLIADLGPFSASGLTVDDGIALTVGAAVSGGPSAAITDAAALTVAAAGSVVGQVVNLSATGIAIGGLVSDGGAGTTHLAATSGAITETGTLISGTLEGGSTGATTLLGASLTTNRIADLGPFSAIGLTVDDGIGLTVDTAVTGGPSAAITDAAGLTIAAAGSVIAQAISLTAGSIGIAGLVWDGSSGTTYLSATTGAIDETGTLISGTLSGNAAGAASLLGATPTTNLIADLGPFTATGLALNDGVSLLIGAPIAGGPNAVITDAGLLTVASSVTATAIDLIAGTLAIPGLVSDGGTGTTQLVAAAGITETGALISGTLSATAAGSTNLSGNNAIAALGIFSIGQGLTLADTTALAVNGPVSAGTAIQFSAAAIDVPGVVTAGTSLTLLSSGTIAETGQLLTPVLTGSAPGSVRLLGAANRIADINGFSAGGLTVDNATNLLLSGTLTSPVIVINDGGSQITLGNNAGIVTGGITRPRGRLAAPPPSSDGGAYLSGAFRQVGNSSVTGLRGGPSILEITAGPGQNVAFDPAGGLHALGTWLVLSVAAGDQVSGNVFVKALDVFHTGIGGGAALFGTINGISGVPAAGAGNIATTSASFRFNNCPISSVNCVLLPVEGIPTGNPLDDFTLGAVANPNDEDELLLPLNANDEDELLPPIVSHQDD